MSCLQLGVYFPSSRKAFAASGASRPRPSLKNTLQLDLCCTVTAALQRCIYCCKVQGSSKDEEAPHRCQGETAQQWNASDFHSNQVQLPGQHTCSRTCSQTGNPAAATLHHVPELVQVSIWLVSWLAVPEVRDDPAILAYQDVAHVQVIVHHALAMHQT